VDVYVQADALRDYAPVWLESHSDRNFVSKITYLLRAFVRYVTLLPGNRIVHLHVATPVSAFRKLLFLIPAKLAGKKIITHVHCSTPATRIEDGPFFRWLYTRLFQSSHLILVLSEAWKGQAARMGITTPMEVLYNPTVPVTPRQFAEERPYILFMGIISQAKGCFDLLQAFKRITDDFPDWQLIFGGSGCIAEGKRMAEELGITDRVTFRGWTKDEEKQQLFREAAIVCLPSHYPEGFPMTVLEAWSYGLPVVCTPAGGLLDVVQDGELALLVKAGDPEGLAGQLRRLMADADLRRQIGDRAHDLAMNTFGLPHISGQLAAIYERLLTGGSLPR
jgi:glycosyltransferase involved in cell wall biosynthesis